MKKYLSIIIVIIIILFVYDYIVYFNGDYYISQKANDLTCFTKVKEDNLMIDTGTGFQVFDIRGVNLGLGKPGEYATGFSITKEEYLRWFEQIQDMGANVIRTYTLAHDVFYDAFYEYNSNNPDPLYLIHGVWVDDYMINSSKNAFDEEFYNGFLNSGKDVIDAIHGKHKNNKNPNNGTQNYRKDISSWVYGYTLGVAWESDIVAFTNETGRQLPEYKGEYLYTENGRNFEIFLAMIGDNLIKYETEKYGAQRTISFINWSTTCPLVFDDNISYQFKKYAQIDVEHILSTTNFKGGQYASYYIYPYYPEYTAFEKDSAIKNSYKEYLMMLNAHHKMPVVVAEFGIPSSRGKTSYEDNRELGRDQGQMNETQQGEAIIGLYEDIVASGCAGGIVYMWQDEWFKKIWNTLASVNLKNNALWSDYQTSGESFGLLSFDPGKEESICYVDGDKSDWEEKDVIGIQDDFRLSMKYDVKFIYLLAEKKGFNINEDSLYIPIDTTPKSGSGNYKAKNILMSHQADFVLEIDGKDNSRILVQERYDNLQAIYGNQLKRGYSQYENVPNVDSSIFSPISLVLQESDYYKKDEKISFNEFDFLYPEEYYYFLQTYETGKLTYGNANPKSKDFNSLADFSGGDGFVEIKIPWGLINFADPSEMKIHDDYYENLGVEYIGIDHMNVGLGDGTTTIEMMKLPLKELGRKPEYHERLKKSYYILQEYWQNS